MYRTQFQKLEVYTEPGSPEKIEYRAYYNKNGDIEIKEVGKKNLYEYIQSFADSVDINVLIKRFTAGDIDAFNQRESQFMDLTSMPRDRFDAINQYNDATAEFMKLDPSIRDKFQNNPDIFFGSIGTKEWFEKLGATKRAENKETLQDNGLAEVKGDNVNE